MLDKYKNEISLKDLILLIASIITLMIGVWSFDSILLLKKGTSAPYFSAISAILNRSVETIILLNNFACLAIFIVFAIIGNPLISVIFYFIRLLPDLAGYAYCHYFLILNLLR